MPPTIGAAIRLMTSEPVPFPYITGNNPNMIEVEVICQCSIYILRLSYPPKGGEIIRIYASKGDDTRGEIYARIVQEVN
jgi:hypothetical protein